MPLNFASIAADRSIFMKLHRVFALVSAFVLVAQVALCQTFQPTSGVNAWNDPLNWSPQTVPNSNTAAATISPATGALTINLNQPIMVNTLTYNKTASTSNVTVGEGTHTLTFDGATPKITNAASGSTTGQTILSAPIAFTSTLTAEQNDNNSLQFTQPLTGSGATTGLTITRLSSTTTGFGAVELGAANSYTGTTTFTNPQTNQNYLLVRLNDANSIPGGISDTGGASNITMSGSVIIGLGASDFTRGLGTGADRIQFLSQGNSGWAAFGQDRVVKVCCNVIGTPPERLIWGSSGANFGTLILGHNLADKTVDLQNRLDLTTSTGSVNRTIRIANGSAAVDAKISAPIVSGGAGPGNLILTGSSLGDGTVSLTAVNTYNGSTTISSGATVRLEIASALPSGNLIFATNGILGLGVGNDSFTRALGTLANQVQFSSGGGFAAFGGNKTVNLGGSTPTPDTVTWGGTNFIPTANSLTLGDANSDGTLDFQNGIDLGVAGDRTILTPDSNSVAIEAKVSGVITGAGNLRKSSPGTLELGNANTYTGTTVLNSGVLLLTNATSIPGGILSTSTGGNIIFTNTNLTTVLGLGQGDFTRALGTGAGQVNLGTNAGFAAYFGNRVVNLGGASSQVTWASGNFVTGLLRLGDEGADATVDFQNPIDLIGGPRTVSAANSTAAIEGVISGVINDSSTGGSLIKDGGGTLKVTAANTYGGGTTISAGRLLVSNTGGSGTGSGPVTVNAGTLGGTGTIAGPISNNGTIAPGDGVGTLTASNNVTHGANSHWAIELSGTLSDQLVVGGNLDLSAVDFLDVTGTGTGPWTIATYAGSLMGTFDNVTSGYTVDYNTPGEIKLNAAALLGDFNSDGKVDAGDYVTWRKNDGTNNALANDNGLGIPVGPAHFNLCAPISATRRAVVAAADLVMWEQCRNRPHACSFCLSCRLLDCEDSG